MNYIMLGSLIANLAISYLNWDDHPRLSGLNLGIAFMCIPGIFT